ncbi:MAG: hypothetical protein EKK64_00490 [Neisseriaceae bacterium]|nr:MAG: hypothetical protein EKK64_00490 [Neisseriaceae bacterium]
MQESFEIKRRFGIEIELGEEVSKETVSNFFSEKSFHASKADIYRPSCNNDFWHIKDDATCGTMGRQGPKGVEVASYVAKSFFDLENICDLISELPTLGCKVNKNCGFHIHADCQDLTKSQVAVVTAFWIKIESCLKYSVPLSRRNNRYCAMLGPKLKIKTLQRFPDAELFYNFCCPKDIGFFENKERKVNFNLVNYARACHYGTSSKKTLELRWPESTLNKNDIKNWTILFLNFIENCKFKEIPDNFFDLNLNETLDILGLNSDFEEIKQLKIWLLKRFSKYTSAFKEEAVEILSLADK